MDRPSWDLPIETEKYGRMRNIARLNFELSGKVFFFVLDDGEEYAAHFVSGETVFFGKEGETLKTYKYKAMRANEFVWIANFMENKKRCVSLIIDTKNNLVTFLIAEVGKYEKRPSLVKHMFRFGAIKIPGEALNTLRHGFTDDLTGKKIAWRYSTQVVLTHIYKSAYSIRSSLANMLPLTKEATLEQREECESRAKRWGETFFEEPCRYVKINKDLYLIAFIEDNRNRVNAPEGGGDMAVLVDTKRVHDVGRVFGATPDGSGSFGLITATGAFVTNADPMEIAQSPYYI